MVRLKSADAADIEETPLFQFHYGSIKILQNS